MASERIAINGLKLSFFLAALWNNQKNTRQVRKLQRKYNLSSYIMGSDMEILIVLHGDGAVKIDCPFLMDILKQFGIDYKKFGPWAGDGYFYPSDYDNINGQQGLGQKIVEQLRATGSVAKV